MSLFKGLGERDLDRLTSAFQHITLEEGDVLCREGERLDYLYLVQRGTLGLLKAFLPLPEADGDGDQQERAEQGKGDAEEVDGECEQRRRQDQHQPVVDDNPPTSSAECSTSIPGDNEPAIPPARPPQYREQSPSPLSFPMKISHFNIGSVGRKEFIGEGGFTSAAFAGAGALETLEGMGPEDGERGSAIGAGAAPPQAGGTSKPRGVRVRGGVSGSSHVDLPGRSSRRVGARHYMVSAVAESRVDVFAAKVSQLLPMQAAALKACWIEGREVRFTWAGGRVRSVNGRVRGDALTPSSLMTENHCTFCVIGTALLVWFPSVVVDLKASLACLIINERFGLHPTVGSASVPLRICVCGVLRH